jgi:hypothetical protein
MARNIKIIVASKGVIHKHLWIFSLDWNLLDEYGVIKLRKSSIAS